MIDLPWEDTGADRTARAPVLLRQRRLRAADIHRTLAENRTTILAAHVPVERFSAADYQRIGRTAESRLAKQLGILASGPTPLRQLRRKLIKPSAQGPRVLGIDDWAWRKGHRYGTILCDLQRGKVVHLLPDRSAESTAEWLRAHPGTDIVSRDRASLYAQAAITAAPQAVQVADRWHLLHNLTEAFIGALVPHHRLLSETARALAKSPEASSDLPPVSADQSTPRIQASRDSIENIA